MTTHTIAFGEASGNSITVGDYRAGEYTETKDLVTFKVLSLPENLDHIFWEGTNVYVDGELIGTLDKIETPNTGPAAVTVRK